MPKSDYSCFCVIFFMTNICVYIQAVVYRIYVYTIKKYLYDSVLLYQVSVLHYNQPSPI